MMATNAKPSREMIGTAATLGRPRDPDVDERVLDTAIVLYAQEGWAGFTFERIARMARVGKGALYRRWQDRAALLTSTLDARWRNLEEINTGTVRGDMIAVARYLTGLLVDSHGNVMIHMQADGRRFEDARIVVEPFRDRTIARIRSIIVRGIERGELPLDVDPDLISAILVGTVSTRVMGTLNVPAQEVRADMNVFADSLVNLLLTGVGCGSGVERHPGTRSPE